jgi:hypothetical protein
LLEKTRILDGILFSRTSGEIRKNSAAVVGASVFSSTYPAKFVSAFNAGHVITAHILLNWRLTLGAAMNFVLLHSLFVSGVKFIHTGGTSVKKITAVEANVVVAGGASYLLGTFFSFYIAIASSGAPSNQCI